MNKTNSNDPHQASNHLATPTAPYQGNMATHKRTNAQQVGLKMARRKVLSHRRRIICDMCVLCSIFGIILMIANTELTIFIFKNGKSKMGTISECLKWIVSLSTVLLLVFLSMYHQVDIQMYMIDNAIEDWRLAITLSRVFLVVLELLVCIIHPLPGNNRLTRINSETRGSRPEYPTMQDNEVPVNVLLSLPMFLRFFIVCRAIMLHSHINQDASAQSLGALNKIQFDFAFIFKSVMNLYSEYVLTIMITFIFLWASWAVRACESYNGDVSLNFFDSMWLIAITFLTVGYGDLVPTTTCGKAVSVMTGIFGVGCTALVVAVLARKLEFSRAEMHVHNFVIGLELGKQKKHAAANVLKEGWLAHKYRKLNMKARAMKHERRLMHAIRQIREVKRDESRLDDNSLTMVELYRAQTYMSKTVELTHSLVQELREQLLGNNESCGVIK